MKIGAVIVGSIHMLAAVILVGGAYFSSFIFGPATKNLDPQSAGKIKGLVGKVFSITVWIMIALLILTGVVRSIFMGALSPDVLFGSAYGAILLTKIMILTIAIVIAVMLTKLGMGMEKLAQSGAAPDVIMQQNQKMTGLAKINVFLGIIIIILAVGLRVVGLPAE